MLFHAFKDVDEQIGRRALKYAEACAVRLQ